MPSHCQYQVTAAITCFPWAAAAFCLLHQLQVLQAEARLDATAPGLYPASGTSGKQHTGR